MVLSSRFHHLHLLSNKFSLSLQSSRAIEYYVLLSLRTIEKRKDFFFLFAVLVLSFKHSEKETGSYCERLDLNRLPIWTGVFCTYYRELCTIECTYYREMTVYVSIYCTAWCSEIGSLWSLDAPELHASVTSENQFHCTRLYTFWFRYIGINNINAKYSGFTVTASSQMPKTRNRVLFITSNSAVLTKKSVEEIDR